MRQKPTFKTLTWIFALAFMLAGMAHAYPMSRIMPSGKIKVYRDGQLVQVLQEEAPLPSGAMLNTEGNCGVRLNQLFMVAEDGSMFSVQDGSNAVQLKIEEGILFFAANAQTGPVVFETPAGVIGTQQIFLQASDSSAMLKGFVDVSGTTTKMGVLEGGSLKVSTPEGEKMIASGRQIVLAQAALIKPAESTGQSSVDQADQSQVEDPSPVNNEDEKIPRTYFFAGGAAALALGAIALGGGGGDDDPAPASPAAP
jgi:hypothetical protein